MRAVTALAVAVVSFFASYWAFHIFTWSWLPTGEADRVVIATALATLVGTSVFMLLGAWVDGKPTHTGKSEPDDSSVAQPPTVAGDHIEVHGPFNAPTVIKGTQVNESQGGKRGRR